MEKRKRNIIIICSVIAAVCAACAVGIIMYGSGGSSETDDNSSRPSSSETVAQESASEPPTEEYSEPETQGVENNNGNGNDNNNNNNSNNNPPAPKPTEAPTARQTVKVTIPEGYTFMQIANTLEKKGVCSAADFYKTAQAYEVKSFNVPSNGSRCFKFEGYLFPDTYEFYTNESPEAVLRKMLNNYAAKSGMPSDETLILASIIEKETRSSDHMKMVSSVFHNRLGDGMKLEADSTREYVNKNITGNSLLSGTDKYAALYNTYKCSGLPAGPICSPGKRAIEAAKNPAQSEYRYFFFGNDNTNHYSKDYDEHKAQMEQYGVQYGH